MTNIFNNKTPWFKNPKPCKLHDFYMDSAIRLSEYSSCVSIKVGAILVKDDKIISFGYNGTPKGHLNCNQVFSSDFDRETHHKWSKDNEIHAEMNCILDCAKNGKSINESTLYVTLHPCNECLKNLIASGIKRVYYLNDYDKFNSDLKINSNIEVIKYK